MFDPREFPFDNGDAFFFGRPSGVRQPRCFLDGSLAMITRLDRDVGRVLDRFHELGLDERKLVFFSSDNGPHKEGGADPLFFHSAGSLRGHKRDLSDGGIRVPMIARWPGKIRAGSTTDQVCAFWDVLPTLADVVHAPPPAGIDGVSLLPTLLAVSKTTGGEQKQHAYLYWEFHEGGSKQPLRLGPWKAIRNKQGGPMELYNVVEDPHEDRNVAAEHPEVVAKAEGILAEARTEPVEWPLKGGN